MHGCIDLHARLILRAWLACMALGAWQPLPCISAGTCLELLRQRMAARLLAPWLCGALMRWQRLPRSWVQLLRLCLAAGLRDSVLSRGGHDIG